MLEPGDHIHVLVQNDLCLIKFLALKDVKLLVNPHLSNGEVSEFEDVYTTVHEVAYVNPILVVGLKDHGVPDEANREELAYLAEGGVLDTEIFLAGGSSIVVCDPIETVLGKLGL